MNVKPLQTQGAVPPHKPAARKDGLALAIVLGGVLLLGGCVLVLVIGAIFYFGQGEPGGEAPAPTAQTTLTRGADTTPTARPSATVTDPPKPSLTFTPTLTPTLGAGSTWVRPLDGMVMVYVPEGSFMMGSNTGDSNEKPPHSIALDDYWIDQSEVTNAMFQMFVNESGYLTDAELLGQSLVYQPGQYVPANLKWIQVAGADWLHPHGPGTSLDGLEDHPVVQVSWNDAVAYCAWAGARLPTEAEWEFAARGTDGRNYPWGNQWPSGSLANFADVNLDAIWASAGVDDGYRFTAPVGNYPLGASPFGAFDMAGNASEWVFDMYGYDYYSQSPASNPSGPGSGGVHVVRGGQWRYTAEGIRATARLGELPKWSIDYSGFRCAGTP